MTTDNTNCPDRTKQYLQSLQVKYRESGIPTGKTGITTLTKIVSSNPMRVLLSIGIYATAQVDLYFKTVDGTLVLFGSSSVPFNVTVTQQLHFTLPTMEWWVFANLNDDYAGVEVVKQ